MKKNIGGALREQWEIIRFFVTGIYRRFTQDEMLLFGSAIAYNCVLCIIPLLLLLTSVIGIFLSGSDATIQHINDLLNAAFPDQPYANKIKSSIQEVVLDIIANRSSFGITSVVILTWTATFLFSAIREVLNRVYRIKSSKMILLTILENIVAVIAVGVLFLLANSIFWITSTVGSFADRIPELQAIVEHPAMQSFPTFITSSLILVMFFIIYEFIPDKRIPARAALVSALTTTVLWVLSGKVFQLYLTRFSSVNMVYGAYSFILVFLVWVEYSSLVFILGGVIGQLYRERLSGPEELAGSA
jgi:membrane protein